MAETDYDLEQVYDEQIFPLMTKIIEICKEHKMPLFTCFQYKIDEDSEEKYHFCTTHQHFGREESPEFKKLAPTILQVTSSGFLAITITQK